MESESNDKPEPDISTAPEKIDLEQLQFYKRVKHEMLTSFVIGILCGFSAGIVTLLMLIPYMEEIPVLSATVPSLIVLSITSLALFTWGLVRSLKGRIK